MDNSTQPSEAPSTSTADGQPQQDAAVKRYKQVAMPTPEQIMQEDIMNNCGVRTVMSAVAGCVLGAAFGIFMGAMDTSAVGQMCLVGEQSTAVDT